MKSRVVLLIVAILVALFASEAMATGMLIPNDKTLPPLSIKSHRVNVEITDQGAVTKVDQVFYNHTSRDLEATYLFPIPDGATATDFALWINGKKIKGEVLPAGQAKSIYTEIVSRMKDPGLLEYLGNGLFKASVYPVPRKGEQRVEIQYTNVIPYDAGVCQYTYPLRTERAGSRTIEDFTLSVKIESSTPIKSVYSPTHEVGVTRESDHLVRAGFEKNSAGLDRDFELFYTVSEKQVGVSLLTHKDGPEGYFLLLVTPSASPDENEIISKDVLFVLDTSGSMKGEKMTRAKEALAYCLKSLHEEDRFSILRFSDGVAEMNEDLTYATPKNIEAGKAFVKKLYAAGGTNINEAMLRALSKKGSADRPGIIVFLTDGQPTVGVTAIKKILDNVSGANEPGWRIFSFGVGTSINTHLLDKLSGDNGGATSYVRPDAQIEREVSSFFRKAEKPVLTDVTLDFGKAKVEDLFPRELPDLFAGTQLVVLGKYVEPAETAVIVEGWRKSTKIGFAEDLSLPKSSADHAFIKQLWATRKVGYLLDAIRFNGEDPELVQEVTRLGREFGIVTPYTSYLVTEPKNAQVPRFRSGAIDTLSRAGDGRFGAGPPAAEPDTDAFAFESAGEKTRNRKTAKSSLADRSSLSAQTGSEAVLASKGIADLKDGERLDNGGATRSAGGKSFVWQNGILTDTKHEPGNKVLKIQFGSEAYFRLLELYPKAKAALALGDKVIVSWTKGRSIQIGADGENSIPDGRIKAFLP
jgi:Ca-activated chloride channel homolog